MKTSYLLFRKFIINNLIDIDDGFSDIFLFQEHMDHGYTLKS